MELEESFSKLINDRENGSTKLMLLFLDLMIKHNVKGKAAKEYIYQLKSNFQQFSVIQNCSELLLSYNNIDWIGFQNIKDQINIASNRILTNLVSKLNDLSNFSILTLSNSETLRYVFNGIKPKSLRIMYSEPGGEGKLLHKSIEYMAELITDRDAINLLQNQQVDYVFLGCDSYSENSWFVNKIKSRLVCELANEKDIPVIVLTSTLKRVDKESPVHSDLLEKVPWNDNIMLVTD